MGLMGSKRKIVTKKNRRDWRNASTIASQARRRYLEGYRWGHRVPPAGSPIEQVLGEYSLSLPS